MSDITRQQCDQGRTTKAIIAIIVIILPSIVAAILVHYGTIEQSTANDVMMSTFVIVGFVVSVMTSVGVSDSIV